MMAFSSLIENWRLARDVFGVDDYDRLSERVSDYWCLWRCINFGRCFPKDTAMNYLCCIEGNEIISFDEVSSHLSSGLHWSHAAIFA